MINQSINDRPPTTVFVALVRFNFKALCHAATIRGQLDFKGSIYRDQHACTYTASHAIISLFVSTYNARAYTHIIVNPVQYNEIWGRRLLGWVGWNMRRYFEGSGISRCGEISKKYSMFNMLKLYNFATQTTYDDASVQIASLLHTCALQDN